MILSEEQANRYQRHITIPEIGSWGQKKIIEACIFVMAGDAFSAAPLLYYLAAAGIGRISCCFIDDMGYEEIFENIRDINNECRVKIIDTGNLNGENTLDSKESFSLSIFLLVKNKVREALKHYSVIEKKYGSTPVIFSLYNGWRAFICYFDKFSDISEIYSDIYDIKNENMNICESEGSIFSSGLLCGLASLEALKFHLKIGLNCRKPLNINLLSMDFGKHDYMEGQVLKSTDNQRKYKNLRSIRDSRVLVAGAGGLGSSAVLSLLYAGVGTIGILDKDIVEPGNLNRQILHSTSRIGMPKVESAELFIKKSFGDVNIIKYHMELDKNNASNIIREYDVIVSGVDNFPSRYLLNDTCYFERKPLVEAGALKFNGLNMTILPGESTCYRCLFPGIPEEGSMESCAKIGVIGPLPGIMGYIQGAEVYKLLAGYGELLTNKIMYFDSLSLDFDIINVDRGINCKLCGEAPLIIKSIPKDGGI